MCGIAGIRKMGDQPIKKSMIQLLAMEMEHRGKDATGFALVKANGSHEVWKQPMPAWQAIASDEWRAWIHKYLTPDVQTVLIHDRSATKGSPDDNENNHPLFEYGPTVMIHNGVIYNDSELFREMKLERKVEVDSDIIRAVLDDRGLTKKGIEGMRKLHGSFAIAACSVAYPGKLLLARSGNPIVLASTPETIMWASTKSALHMASRDYVARWGLMFHENRTHWSFLTMPDHTAWLWGEKGIEWHDEVKVAVNFQPKCYDATGDWIAHKNRWGKAPVVGELIVCPNEECRRLCRVPEDMKELKPWELECNRCKKPLGVRPA